MKRLVRKNRQISRKTIVKAIMAVIAVILFFIVFKVKLPFPAVAINGMKIVITAFMLFLMLSFRTD
ncbi:MAG TPA: hypothetical protein DD432_10060 [Eubacterium sp.]|nr:hypothetical protein [Eubacterium sp.]